MFDEYLGSVYQKLKKEKRKKKDLGSYFSLYYSLSQKSSYLSYWGTNMDELDYNN